MCRPVGRLQLRELNRPLADQLTLQRASLLIGQIGFRDLQHYTPSTAGKRILRHWSAQLAQGRPENSILPTFRVSG